MSIAENTSGRIQRIVYFFPFQLLWLQFKKNHLLLIFWLILFGIATSNFAVKFGLPGLMLYPEYLGESGIMAFFILGFSLGGFIMAFNIYTYILHAFRFPFLATIARPFAKFCINNFIIPLTFVVLFIKESTEYQINNELLSVGDVALNLAAFMCGQFFFILVALVYFFRTNKDIFKLTGKTEEELFATVPVDPRKQPSVRSKKKWYLSRSYNPEWRVVTYLRTPFSVALARESAHYDKETIRSVFAQNHINATLFEVAVIVSFLIIGSYRENEIFVIPAMATAMLMFTMFLMLLSIFISWLRSWTFTVLIVIFLIVNWASTRYPWANIDNHAYGLDYQVEPAKYDARIIDSLRNEESDQRNDLLHTIGILNNWRLKNTGIHASAGRKPKLVLINTSGGGSRAALWTFRAIQYNDSLLNGALLRSTPMITGSSGGMIGAAYLRQLALNYADSAQAYYNHPEYLDYISRDILNPVLFSLATNDLFVRYQRFELEEGLIYTKDRATSFERQLNQNTNGILNRKLIDYSQPEAEARIPMMIFSPTITDDSRRLIVSAQPTSYLTNNHPSESMRNTPVTESVEFMRFFSDQRAENLEFLSLLRMSATFPYVMPSVSMPSEPKIQVMDAGLRDNFGMRTSLQFIAAFRDWISTNTSGIVIVQVRDKEKDFETEKSSDLSIIQSLINPLGSVYGNFTKVQDYTHDQMLQYTSLYFDKPIDVINFELFYDTKQPISLSWHLTSLEKRNIIHSVHHPNNAEATARLRKLLEN